MYFDQKVSESIDDETMEPWSVHAVNVKDLIQPIVRSVMYTIDNIINLEDTPYSLGG